MRTRLTAALLLGGQLLLASLTPVAAMAAPVQPAGPPATGSYRALDSGCYGCDDPYHRRDDHYRCMYHCDERYGYGRRDGYDRSRYGQDRYRQDRYRQDGGCWYHDSWGWRRCRSGYGYRDGHGSDASGGYDSHRHHPR